MIQLVYDMFKKVKNIYIHFENSHIVKPQMNKYNV